MRINKGNSKGFTLIELLVVIAVMAILASIVLSALTGAQGAAFLAKRQAEAAANNRSILCEQGQFMDLDGYLYDTVEIRGICWMKENLRYLPDTAQMVDNATWQSIGYSAPQYAVYGVTGGTLEAAKATTNYQEKGVLYNWPAAMEACPPGTRLPTDTEQHALESAFWTTGTCDPGRSAAWGCERAGEKLKTSAFGGDNASGFSAISAGRRYTDGSFNLLATHANFWSSSSDSSATAWRRYLNSSQVGVYRNANNKGRGFSVRCVR